MCTCLILNHALDHAGTGAVSDACREEVYQFKIQRNTNINLNVPLGGISHSQAQQLKVEMPDMS
jgi:hypothetical protein